MVYLSDSAFDFYFDRFTLDNAPTEEAKDYGLVKKVMQEKFPTQKTESEIMRKCLPFNTKKRGDIPTFLSRADKAYNQGKVGHNFKLKLLRAALKSEQMFFQFVLFKGSKNYEAIKKACLEYAENIKMIDGSTTSTFQQAKKSDKDPKEATIDELCKQDENLHFVMMKQLRQAPKQAEPMCYNCGKRGRYASKCRMEQELTCYKCEENGHRASECRSKVNIPPTCTYCHRVGQTVENCFVKRSSEAVGKQAARFAKKPKGIGPSGQGNIMFVKEDDPVKEEDTMAAFKRSADG